MAEDIGMLTSSLRSSIRELVGTIEALEDLAADDGEPGMSPEEEARIIEHLAESFEAQIIRDLEARQLERPPRKSESILNLSYHWRIRAEIARSTWEAANHTLQRRIQSAELSPEARGRLRCRVRDAQSALLLRPDCLKDPN